MPPLKTTIKKSSVNLDTENAIVKTINTRSSKVLSSSLKKETAKDVGLFPKRKASPIKGNTLKRSALGNITNAIETQCIINSGKKPVKKTVSSTITKPTISTTAKTNHAVSSIKPIQKPVLPSVRPSVHVQANAAKSMLPPLPKSRLRQTASTVSLPRPTLSLASKPVKVPSVPAKHVDLTEKQLTCTVKTLTRQSPAACKKPSTSVVTASQCKVTAKPKCMVNNVPNTRRSSGRRSTLDPSDASSLYVSALSDVLDDGTPASSANAGSSPLPQPLINIDEEYANDPFQCATYAFEIFEYLKSREEYFKISEYMESQPSLSQHVRAVLVDWMVEIQESFELNHETLYLGVKLVDCYLSKIKVSKISMQLIGATAMFIASKYDERIPPAIEDFLFICNGAYERRDFTKMEVNILKVVNFELGFPLSYRFLRRYARCVKTPMPLLTLARYILEHSLMDYATITLSDSKLAAAALYLAIKMKKEMAWDNTLLHFSGYKVKDFIDVAHTLNNSLHQKPRQSLQTVRNKYSHKIFYEVAKTPLISNEDL